MKYMGQNTIKSFIELPSPNNLSLTGRYIGGTAGSVLVNMDDYRSQREVIDRIGVALAFLEKQSTICANDLVIQVLDKYAREKALSRFDLYQNGTCFITIQQLSIIMSVAISIKARTQTDARWPAIQKWFAETADIYARYFEGEQLSIEKYCTPTVFYNNKFIPVAEAIRRKLQLKTFTRLNNIQLSKLIMLALVAVLNNDTKRMQKIVDEMIDHIDRNKYDDDFKPRAQRVMNNSVNGGTYNFQCGFIASESNRRSLILHYNSYYVQFLWTLFYIFKAVSTKDKDYMQPFYKYKNDISLVIRNMTDPSSVRTTATPQNAGRIYIEKYKKVYMDLIKYDLTQPPPENRNQPAMQLMSAKDAEIHNTNFAYFFGTMDMKIPRNACDQRGKPVSLTGMTEIPNVGLVHSTTSMKIFESIRVLQKV